MVSASSWSWVTITVVRPSLRCSSRISTRTSWRSLASRLDERLVEQQHVGPDDQRAGQRHALLLAAGQLARQAVAEMIEPHQAQAPPSIFGADLRLRQLAHLEAEGDVLRHRHVRKQRIALEHHAGVALPRRQRGDVAFAQAYAAGRSAR